MQYTSPAQPQRGHAILAALGAVLFAILACVTPGGGSVSPNDTRLQPPTYNSGLHFADFFAQLHLFPSQLVPIPWITAPVSPAPYTASLQVAGWGPGRLDRPWPGDPTRSPELQLYQLTPAGCGSAMTRTLLGTAQVTDSRNWGLALSLSQPYAVIAATVVVGSQESGLSNKIIVGQSNAAPTIDPVTSTSLTGTGPVGYCVMLLKDGQPSVFYSATIGPDGHWSLSNVPGLFQATTAIWDASWIPPDAQNSDSHKYQVRLLALESDSQPVTITGLADKVDAILAGTGLSGQGSAIIQYAKQYGVNPVLALAMFEKEASFAAVNTAANRNNNPGNIEATGTCSRKAANTPCNGIYGEVSTDGRFGKYATMTDGVKAYFMLLSRQYKPGPVKNFNCSDIPCLVSIYCPPSDCGTQAYINQITGWVQGFRDQLSKFD